MKTNFQLETERIISSLRHRPKLLLHSCCGPCSSYVLEYLLKYFEITVFFYNPNIQPEEEYARRLETQKQLIYKMCPQVRLLEPGWCGGDYDAVTRGLEYAPEGGARCERCFELRLNKTAETSRELDFEYFCTTLSVSPHKNAELINRIGFSLQDSLSVKWLPGDFKKREGYKRSIELSQQYGLYRQDYCGCTYSKTPPIQ